MPVYLHPSNLIFDKKAITSKYNGGCDQFRKDWAIGKSTVNQEDDELFLIAKMNPDEFNLDLLSERGIHINLDFESSEDYILINRYGGISRDSTWLEYNSVFAWHRNCSTIQKDKASEISSITVSEIQERMEKGDNPLSTIKSILTEL